MPTFVIANVIIQQKDRTTDRFHCPMNALKPFFLSLDNPERYALQEKDITKLSVDMAVEFLLQIEKISFEITQEEN